jgi:hypothetical protein
MGKEKPTSFLWLFLSCSLLHFRMVWYFSRFSPSNSPLPQAWADFVQASHKPILSTSVILRICPLNAAFLIYLFNAT